VTVNMPSQQVSEQEASRLYQEGEIDRAIQAFWVVLTKQPKSPVSSLAFKISREQRNSALADDVRRFLEQHEAFNDQAKLDWVSVQIALGNRPSALPAIAELMSSEKSIAFRLHVVKVLSAQGFSFNTAQETDQLEEIKPANSDEPRFPSFSLDHAATSDSRSTPSDFGISPSPMPRVVEPVTETAHTDLVGSPALTVVGGSPIENFDMGDAQKLALRAREFGEARDLSGLMNLYLEYRDRPIAGQREFYLTVVLKSLSVIAGDLAESNRALEERLACVKHAELVLGDLLETRWMLFDQQLVPMIETHLAANLPRSAAKYLNWSMKQGRISFRYQLWPFVVYFRRTQDVQGLLDFLNDCASSGNHPDAFAIALLCRELNRVERAREAYEYLTGVLTDGAVMDSHMLMAGLESLVQMKNVEELVPLLERSLKDLIPDSKAFGFVADSLYLNRRFSACSEVVQLAASHGVSDDLLRLRESLARLQAGDVDGVLQLIPSLAELNVHSSKHIELLRTLSMHGMVPLVAEAAKQMRLLVRRSAQAREDFLRSIENQLPDALFGNELKFCQEAAELLREIDPNSPLIRVHDLASKPEQLEVATVELGKAFMSAVSADSGLSDQLLHDLFAATSKFHRVRPALWLLDELVNRGTLNSWHLGTVLRDFLRAQPPERLEELYLHYLPALGSVDERSHRILFNLLIRAYRFAGRRQDLERIRRRMHSLGVSEDEWTLREVLEISSTTASKVGTDLGGTDSLDFAALRRVLDDLRHELSHFVAQLSLRLQAVADGLDGARNPEQIQGIRDVLGLTRSFSERIEGYSDIADPNMSGVCDLETVITEVITDYQKKSLAAGVNLTVSAGVEQYWVAISDYGLRTVIENLLSNSLKEFESFAVDSPAVQVIVFGPKLAIPGNLVSISVRDNGRGIPHEISEQIFSRGFTTRSGHGFGLGLALVRSTIESVGGNIQLVNDGTPGAHFLIQLRLSEPPND
jgi:signal transduction histidine kinase